MELTARPAAITVRQGPLVSARAPMGFTGSSREAKPSKSTVIWSRTAAAGLVSGGTLPTPG